MAETAQDQSEYWNGEVGKRWAANQSTIDAMFAPLTQALLERAELRPGQRLIDIGCGAGDTTLQAASRLGPDGHVTAIDLSTPLLAVARERERASPADRAPISWIEADAETSDLGRDMMDHALSRFGVMFFSDSVAALSRIREALAPGGRLTFLCWRRMEDNPWVTVPYEVTARLVPDLDSPDPEAPGPFRFADGDKVTSILADAGYGDIACTPLDRDIVMGRSADGIASEAAANAARFAVEMGPVARHLRERDPALRARAQVAVAEAFAAHVADGEVRLVAGCWLVSAQRRADC